jgi:hypothetical protein
VDIAGQKWTLFAEDTMKQCIRCDQLKPPDAFKRRASLSQSRAWTKNPAMKMRLNYESAVCNECARTYTKSVMKLSPAEARKRMVNEGKTQLEIDGVLARMRKIALVSKKSTILKNRQARFAPDYEAMSKQLDREKKRAMRAPDPERLNEILRANEIFKRLKHEGRKPPKSWVELLSNKFATWCSKTVD